MPHALVEPSLFWISALVLLALAIMFAASCAMFYMLVERWTSKRQWLALSDWSKDHGLRFRQSQGDEAPPPLDAATGPRPAMRVCMTGRQTKLLRLESPAADASPGEVGRAATWNLLIRQIERPWPPTGLRPTGTSASVVDLYSLTSFPLLGNSERFVLYGTDSIAAAVLSRSPARGLLPPDVGLLIHGRNLVLDFSGRPFDEIEFERMIVVAEQLAAHLPVPEERSGRMEEEGERIGR